MTFELFYTWLWIFIIYAFWGWCIEVIYHAVINGTFTNRGFLNGVICPVYGFGMLIVTMCLEPLIGNPLYVFIGGVVLTSAIEFIAGAALERFFNDKWWDYSNQPFNIRGYICLRFSLVWGLAVLTTIYAIHPFIMSGIDEIPVQLGIVLLSGFYATLLTDVTVTTVDTLKLKQKLAFASTTEQRIRKMSDGIGGVLAEGTLNAKEKLEVGRDKALEGTERAKLRLTAGQRRLLKAYPRLKRGKNREGFAKLLMLTFVDRIGRKADSPKSIREDAALLLYQNTFSTIVDVLEARDEYTAGHSIRVSELAARFCEILKLSPLDTEVIVTSAKVHDIGKVGVPDITLNKIGEMTDKDWENIRKHPDIGADIIIRVGNLENIADIVRSHHEHFDGSGYPKGLKGDETPYGAQIIAICDAVDAMRYSRIYRRALETDECLGQIKSNSGVMFNSTLVEEFLKNWDYIIGDLYTPEKGDPPSAPVGVDCDPRI